MTDAKYDDGTIQTLLDRLNNFRLPRALALKDRVDAGGLLEDSDIEFLQRVFEDANSVQALIQRNPELVHHMSTADVAADMDEIRIALGDDKLN